MFKNLGMGAILASASLPAFAAYDVTAATSEITGAVTVVGAIGGAVLLVVLAIKAYKWFQRAT